jgi:hypothetical protein
MTESLVELTPSHSPWCPAGAGVTTATWWDVLPDVPTLADTVAGYEATAWIRTAARHGVPREILEMINHELNAGLATCHRGFSLPPKKPWNKNCMAGCTLSW